ncbi:hypothetical protein [Bdellovibrio sp.]|uniref:hypothetical protein n=1 Tax=Bdellovibrio sp. TaxID=28201 RepID=UPI0039E47F37
MFRVITVILFAMSLQVSAFAWRESNGGMVVKDGENYVTIGTAKTEVSLWKATEDATFLGVEQELLSLKLPIDVKMQLWTSFFPSGSRKYFALDERNVPQKDLEALLYQYHFVNLERSEGKKVIAGFTSKTQTFLLNPFFKLSERGKMALLFHEMLWVQFPMAKTEDVMSAEIHFENYLAGGSPKALIYSLESMFGRPDLYLRHILETQGTLQVATKSLFPEMPADMQALKDLNDIPLPLSAETKELFLRNYTSHKDEFSRWLMLNQAKLFIIKDPRDEPYSGGAAWDRKAEVISEAFADGTIDFHNPIRFSDGDGRKYICFPVKKETQETGFRLCIN